MKSISNQNNRKESNLRSVSLSTGYDLAKATNSGENYNPSKIDSWFSEQRKKSLKFAQKFIES
ncbi:hypothetical protein C2869_08425 [Saccharobesus litoralis]|uniref:Uncharacterized protein n=1 Tax=Saccharobesus litoralis TaxID=2172099 RepID=A0A2S0VQI5_9ALTE|nr:hypothetical protein [Saccharobesus litoralis]AWB66449.1 hypothetical protein C2869_08425 [Saccharobesus litoralis]